MGILAARARARCGCRARPRGIEITRSFSSRTAAIVAAWWTSNATYWVVRFMRAPPCRGPLQWLARDAALIRGGDCAPGLHARFLPERSPSAHCRSDPRIDKLE